MKRAATCFLVIAIALLVWGNQAMAIKAVSKSSNDSVQTKTSPATPDKPSDIKTPQSPTPPSVGQKPATPAPPETPTSPRDNFIDRDNDGINDNIKQHKEPEIKRDRVEPSRPVETPRKSEPVKKNETKKADDEKTSSKKH
jgi:hypothetical protein